MAEHLDAAAKMLFDKIQTALYWSTGKKCMCKEIGLNINSLSPMKITTEAFYMIYYLKKDGTQFLYR